MKCFEVFFSHFKTVEIFFPFIRENIKLNSFFLLFKFFLERLAGKQSASAKKLAEMLPYNQKCGILCQVMHFNLPAIA